MVLRRVDLLRQVLRVISDVDYAEENGYIEFGAESVSDVIINVTDPPDQHSENSVERALAELIVDLKIHTGRIEAAQRISLGRPPVFATNAIRNLCPEDQDELRELINAIPKDSTHGSRPKTPPEWKVEDVLEVAFAEEVLGKLPKIVDRASRLVKLNLEGVPPDVARYFGEAHRCYLYGFHVACAVLCRAILSSALEQKIDSERTIAKSLRNGESYFGKLVEKAQERGILRDDRPEWALKVRDAGNEAIHDLGRFEKHWEEDRDSVLLYTRIVLLDLYSPHPEHGS